jgi:hypothetical protein
MAGWRSAAAPPRLTGKTCARRGNHVSGQPTSSKRNRLMQAMLIIFMVLAALATLGVLARGIIIMARGKDVTGKQSNKMMSYRVAFQALAIVFIIILFLINRQG